MTQMLTEMELKKDDDGRTRLSCETIYAGCGAADERMFALIVGRGLRNALEQASNLYENDYPAFVELARTIEAQRA